MNELVRCELDNGFLSNTPTHRPRPRNLPWVYYLFTTLVWQSYYKDKKGVRRWRSWREKKMEVLEGLTKRDANAQLLAFVEDPKVVVVN